MTTSVSKLGPGFIKASHNFLLSTPASSHDQRQPRPTTIIAGRLPVPPEMLLEIAKHTSTPTLASLCAANSQFYALCIPILYRRGVEIASNDYEFASNLAVKLIVEDKVSSMAKLLQYGLSANTCSLWLWFDRGPSSVKDLSINMSLLQQSVLCGRITMTKMLLDYGAEVDHKDSEGRTALHYALWDRNSSNFQFQEPLINMLVEHGADVNVKAIMGIQPMHVPAGVNNWAAVGLLVRHGANISPVDDNGRTPIMRAMELDVGTLHHRVVEELLKYGAQAPPPIPEDDDGFPN
jgi:hypothetical protein